MVRIRDWEKHFEKGRSRGHEGPMDWYPAPTDLSGLGYMKLCAKGDAGARTYMVWCAFCAIAAAIPQDRRNGMLATNSGRPYTIEEISLKSHLPENWIQEAIPVLIDLGWLERDIRVQAQGEQPHTAHGAAGQDGLSHREEVTKEEHADSGPVTPSLKAAFDRITEKYPHCKSYDDAYRMWMTYCEQGVVTEANVHQVEEGLQRWLDSDEWSRENGRYIPSFYKWLIERRWKDRPKPSTEAEARRRGQKKSSEGNDALAIFEPEWENKD